MDSSSTVIVNITNSINDVVSFERRFPKDLKIRDLKEKLEIITGCSAATMVLELYSGDNMVALLSDENAFLGFYSPQDGHRIHVKGTASLYNLEESVAKFELSEEQYDERKESLRHFLKQNKLGKYNAEELKKMEEAAELQKQKEAEALEKITIGSRCKVTVKGKPTRFGTVRYKGVLEGKTGTFVGVQFDEPLGNNDGSVGGAKYFECPPKYGSFVPPVTVEVGEFPPEDDLDDEL